MHCFIFHTFQHRRNCATVGFSDVTSANIVGFQNEAAENASGYTWMANTFQKVDGSTVKLSDFTIKENLNPTVAMLYLLSKTGATLVDEKGNKCVYIYLNPTKAGTKAVPGWYLNGTASKDMQGPGSDGWANDVVIKAGQGFGLFRGTTSATLIVPSPLVDHKAAE